MQYVCNVMPWKGGNTNLNGVWISDHHARIFINKNSLPRPSLTKPFHHIISIYMPYYINGINVTPKRSRTFDNNIEDFDNYGPCLLVPEAHFNCNQFMACTSQNCIHHTASSVQHINCWLQKTSPINQGWVTGGWCSNNKRVCLEIRSAGVGYWLEALYQQLKSFPQLTLYHLSGYEYLIA